MTRKAPPPLLIDPEFKQALPTHTKEEAAGLRESILREHGRRDPVLYVNAIIWDDCPRGGKHTPDDDGICSKCQEPARNLIVDGMTGFDICVNEGEPFTAKEMQFASRADALEWILDNQLHRRNLQPAAYKLLRGKLMNMRKGAAHRPEVPPSQRVANNPDKLSGLSPKERNGDTAARIAEEYGVSERQVYRDAKAAEAVGKIVAAAPALKAPIEQGTIPLSATPALADAPADELAWLETLEGPELKVAAKDTAAKAAANKGNGKAGSNGKSNRTKPPVKQATPADTARAQVKTWTDAVGRWLSNSPSIDDIRNQFPSKQGDGVVNLAVLLFEALKKWEKVIK